MKATAEYIKTRIVRWLLDGGMAFNPQRDAVGVEVLFSRNRRRADVLVITKLLHSLEIKSDFDNTMKLERQIRDYLRTFDKTSIVTTPRHIERIAGIVPNSVGLIYFTNGNFRIVRRAKLITNLDRVSLLMFLTKKELIKVFAFARARRLSTQEIRVRLSTTLSVQEVRNAVSSFIRKRYQSLFQAFLQDTTRDSISRDDLRGLSGKIDLIGN